MRSLNSRHSASRYAVHSRHKLLERKQIQESILPKRTALLCPYSIYWLLDQPVRAKRAPMVRVAAPIFAALLLWSQALSSCFPKSFPGSSSWCTRRLSKLMTIAHGTRSQEASSRKLALARASYHLTCGSAPPASSPSTVAQQWKL